MQPRQSSYGLPQAGTMRFQRPPLPTQHQPPPTQHQPPPPAQARPNLVLYTHPNCPQSNGLIQQLMQRPRIQGLHIQDVNKLTERPPWLDGVPTLADTRLGIVYKGSDALMFMEKVIQQSASLPVSPPPPPPLQEQKMVPPPLLWVFSRQMS